jgi:hypothetical protein
MAYVVRAINADGVTGTFTAEKDARREALDLAKTLREEGFWVIVTGPDGETVDETEDE